MNKLLINNPPKKKPIFSIITVVKNDQKNIGKTIKSVAHQSFKNFEYIIIDGKSSDQTITMISKLKKKINLLISEPDMGIYYAMNKGIKLASGEIIVFINSGDLFTKNALKIIHGKFYKKKIDYVFGTVQRHYTKKSIVKSGFNLKRLFYNFDFATAHSTGFFLRRKIYNLVGNFNTKYKYSADYDIYYKVLLKLRLKGESTSKKQLIGVVAAGGFSSKVSFFEHLKEEIKIRVDNNQNIFLVIIILLNALIKYYFK